MTMDEITKNDVRTWLDNCDTVTDFNTINFYPEIEITMLSGYRFKCSYDEVIDLVTQENLNLVSNRKNLYSLLRHASVRGYICHDKDVIVVMKNGSTFKSSVSDVMSSVKFDEEVYYVCEEAKARCKLNSIIEERGKLKKEAADKDSVANTVISNRKLNIENGMIWVEVHKAEDVKPGQYVRYICGGYGFGYSDDCPKIINDPDSVSLPFGVSAHLLFEAGWDKVEVLVGPDPVLNWTRVYKPSDVKPGQRVRYRRADGSGGRVGNDNNDVRIVSQYTFPDSLGCVCAKYLFSGYWTDIEVLAE